VAYIAGVDAVKLKTCTACKYVRYFSVKREMSKGTQTHTGTGLSTKQSARRKLLNCVMKFYSSSLTVATLGIAPFFVCRYRLMQTKLLLMLMMGCVVAK